MTSRILDLQGHPLLTVQDDRTAVSTSTWSAVPFDMQASASATALALQDPCSDHSQLVAGTPNASPNVYKISAFAAEVSARRNVRCATGDELAIVVDLLLGGGTTSALEYALWNGSPGWDPALAPSLLNTDVETVGVGSTTSATLAAVINRYSTLTVMQGYVVHLGVGAALELSAQGYMYNNDQLGHLVVRATGAPVVVSPYYPTAGVALTGPLQLFVGPPDAFQVYDSLLNRTNIVGNQLLAIAFDPSTSVRAV